MVGQTAATSNAGHNCQLQKNMAWHMHLSDGSRLPVRKAAAVFLPVGLWPAGVFLYRKVCRDAAALISRN